MRQQDQRRRLTSSTFVMVCVMRSYE